MKSINIVKGQVEVDVSWRKPDNIGKTLLSILSAQCVVFWGVSVGGAVAVGVLNSRSSGPGSTPCCVLGQDTLLSQCLSPPRSK